MTEDDLPMNLEIAGEGAHCGRNCRSLDSETDWLSYGFHVVGPSHRLQWGDWVSGGHDHVGEGLIGVHWRLPNPSR